MTKIKSSAKAYKWAFGCHSSDMISLATRFQNIGPVQDPCAHPCCCDQLTELWAVWMVTFLSVVKTSLDVQGDDHCVHFLVFSILYLFNQLVDGVVSGSALSKTELIVMKYVFLFECVVESSEKDLFQHFAYGWK
ncbi:hypothetical protein AVEN_8486-1 [Araneus ventricosus]|uniref:Uncharacterized protein n=1 Tax=Araneus ventricosus TaxID=182803 RepID=A0A4Y2IF32_ARAVE|nr:hypothetical protein AVEN_8486-1 [Araneus ventricosus]